MSERDNNGDAGTSNTPTLCAAQGLTEEKAVAIDLTGIVRTCATLKRHDVQMWSAIAGTRWSKFSRTFLHKLLITDWPILVGPGRCSDQSDMHTVNQRGHCGTPYLYSTTASEYCRDPGRKQVKIMVMNCFPLLILGLVALFNLRNYAALLLHCQYGKLEDCGDIRRMDSSGGQC